MGGGGWGRRQPSRDGDRGGDPRAGIAAAASVLRLGTVSTPRRLGGLARGEAGHQLSQAKACKSCFSQTKLTKE